MYGHTSKLLRTCACDGSVVPRERSRLTGRKIVASDASVTLVGAVCMRVCLTLFLCLFRARARARALSLLVCVADDIQPGRQASGCIGEQTSVHALKDTNGAPIMRRGSRSSTPCSLNASGRWAPLSAASSTYTTGGCRALAGHAP